MKMLIRPLIGISMLSTYSVSHASEDFYIGLNVGQASYDVTLDEVSLALDDGSFTSASLDDDDKSIRFALGYKLNPNFSFEGGVTTFGELTYDAISDGSGFVYPPGHINFKVTADGLFLDIKGQVPLNERFSIYGKFGLLDWTSTVTTSISTVDGSSIEENSGNDSFFGIGGSVVLNKSEVSNIELNIDYTFYELDDLGVDVLSVGVQLGY